MSLDSNCRYCSNFHDIMDATNSKYSCNCRCHAKEKPFVWDKKEVIYKKGPHSPPLPGEHY